MSCHIHHKYSGAPISDLHKCDGSVPNISSGSDSSNSGSNEQGQEDCCDEDHPCGEGEGDCDDDDDCLPGLICGDNNCAKHVFFRGADCC